MNYNSNIQKLILNDYTTHLCNKKNVNSKNLKPETVKKNFTESTNLHEFDLQDKKEQIIQKAGAGSVTYKNPFKKDIYVTDYERFINSLPDSVQKGLKRCDFLVYSQDFQVIILNELSQSKNEFDKESHAIHQLSESLNSLLGCVSLRDELNKYTSKLCVFSNRYKEVKSPEGMADPFGLIFNFVNSEISSEEFENIPEISRLGFQYCKSSVIEINRTLKFWK